MKEQIIEILNQYIAEMVAFQSEYEYGCYERGLYPKSAYERIYNALHNAPFMEEYLKKKGVNTSNFEVWYSIFIEVRNNLNLSEIVHD